MKKRIAIFISGRGSNMEAIIGQTRNGILRNSCEIILVFSNDPQAKGLETARRAGIETAAIPSRGKPRAAFDREVLELLRPYELDYIVLAGYMRLLSPEFVHAWEKRIINIHPADTRAFQGVGGYAWAFEQGLEKTRVTVHYIDEGMDTGEIIEQRELDLRDLKTLEAVERRGLALEHAMYSEVLKKIFET